jgi:hypothetical protein
MLKWFILYLLLFNFSDSTTTQGYVSLYKPAEMLQIEGTKTPETDRPEEFSLNLLPNVIDDSDLTAGLIATETPITSAQTSGISYITSPLDPLGDKTEFDEDIILQSPLL